MAVGGLEITRPVDGRANVILLLPPGPFGVFAQASVFALKGFVFLPRKARTGPRLVPCVVPPRVPQPAPQVRERRKAVLAHDALHERGVVHDGGEAVVRPVVVLAQRADNLVDVRREVRQIRELLRGELRQTVRARARHRRERGARRTDAFPSRAFADTAKRTRLLHVKDDSAPSGASSATREDAAR